MNRVFQKLTRCTAVAGVCIFTLSLTGFVAGARINTTKSIAVGLYWIDQKPAQKGAYVLFCPPDTPLIHEAWTRGYIGSGQCPGGYGFLMKRILAAKKDSISIAASGVRVNGMLLPLSTPVKSDRAGRPLVPYPATNYELGGSEVLLMSDVSSTSFDGRYFGPINISQIKAAISPVITW